MVLKLGYLEVVIHLRGSVPVVGYAHHIDASLSDVRPVVVFHAVELKLQFLLVVQTSSRQFLLVIERFLHVYGPELLKGNLRLAFRHRTEHVCVYLKFCHCCLLCFAFSTLFSLWAFLHPMIFILFSFLHAVTAAHGHDDIAGLTDFCVQI